LGGSGLLAQLAKSARIRAMSTFMELFQQNCGLRMGKVMKTEIGG
jgi:hypothetical protein